MSELKEDINFPKLSARESKMKNLSFDLTERDIDDCIEMGLFKAV